MHYPLVVAGVGLAVLGGIGIVAVRSPSSAHEVAWGNHPLVSAKQAEAAVEAYSTIIAAQYLDHTTVGRVSCSGDGADNLLFRCTVPLSSLHQPQAHWTNVLWVQRLNFGQAKAEVNSTMSGVIRFANRRWSVDSITAQN